MSGIWNFNQITDELYKRMQILLENRINFYLIPEEWRITKTGLIDIIAHVLNLKVIDLLHTNSKKLNYQILGKICQIPAPSPKLIDLVTLIKNKTNIPSIQYLGDKDSPIKHISIILDEEISFQTLSLVKRLNIDTIICFQSTFEIEKLAEEYYINLICVSPYIINLGLLKLTQSLKMEEPSVEFTFLNLKSSFETL